jgi:putative transcriptional regulator
MTPVHHPSSDRLIEYAAGSLSRERRLVVGAHLRVCPICTREVAVVEAVGGVLLDALPAASMASDALAHALARIERPAPPRAARPPAMPDWIDAPAIVLDAARRRKRWAAPGVWVAPVTGGPFGRRSYLLSMAAGMGVPRHTHRGLELVCVLKGALEDRGVIYGPGDFCESDESVEHQPRVTDAGECVCFAAVDASLVARDWVGRVFQPLVMI